jgi:cytochrome c oxidase subunit 4
MSTAAHAHSPQEVLAQESKRYYAFVNLAMFLSLFTGIEIVIIFVRFPPAVLMSVLVTVSIVKFFCVIFWFMHLIYDAPLLTILFLAGMVLAGGTMLALLGLFEHSDIDPAILHDSLASPPATQSAWDANLA